MEHRVNTQDLLQHQVMVGDNKINLINTLNKFRPDTFVNPYNFSVDLNKNIGPFGLNSFINTLGILGIDDPRTPEDESEQDDYGISARLQYRFIWRNFTFRCRI
jgi:hypothetical protein